MFYLALHKVQPASYDSFILFHYVFSLSLL